MKTGNDQNPKKIKGAVSTVGVATTYLKDLLTAGPQGALGKGVELGMGAVLAKTLLKRLPPPFNFVAPIVAEKVIMKHGIEGGREILLKGLKWVKKVTDDPVESPSKLKPL